MIQKNKIIILLLIIVSSFIVWEKRVYLQRTFPNVLHLIQEQYKWKQKNTGTYVYKYVSNNNSFGGAILSPYLLFIKDEKLQRAIHLGNGYRLESLLNRKAIEQSFLMDLESNRDSYYVIDTRFNEIWSAFLANYFSFDVEYNDKYGYPKIIHEVMENPVEYNKKIVFDGINVENKFAFELKMFSANTEFTEKFLAEVLNEYREADLAQKRRERNDRL